MTSFIAFCSHFVTACIVGDVGHYVCYESAVSKNGAKFMAAENSNRQSPYMKTVDDV
jgi:hypothetical protein